MKKVKSNRRNTKRKKKKAGRWKSQHTNLACGYLSSVNQSGEALAIVSLLRLPLLLLKPLRIAEEIPRRCDRLLQSSLFRLVCVFVVRVTPVRNSFSKEKNETRKKKRNIFSFLADWSRLLLDLGNRKQKTKHRKHEQTNYGHFDARAHLGALMSRSAFGWLARWLGQECALLHSNKTHKCILNIPRVAHIILSSARFCFFLFVLFQSYSRFADEWWESVILFHLI